MIGLSGYGFQLVCPARFRHILSRLCADVGLSVVLLSCSWQPPATADNSTPLITTVSYQSTPAIFSLQNSPRAIRKALVRGVLRPCSLPSAEVLAQSDYILSNLAFAATPYFGRPTDSGRCATSPDRRIQCTFAIRRILASGLGFCVREHAVGCWEVSITELRNDKSKKYKYKVIRKDRRASFAE